METTNECGFFAVCELSNEGGNGGPKESIPTTIETAVADAIAWSDGQIGHPWDCIIVTVYDSDDEGRRNPIEAHQIECRDGSWEVV